MINDENENVNEIQQFNFNDLKIRAITKDGEQWFIAKWVLTAHFLDKGYGRMVAYQYTNSAGEKCTTEQLRWTQACRMFVLDLLKKRNAGVKK